VPKELDRPKKLKLEKKESKPPKNNLSRSKKNKKKSSSLRLEDLLKN